MTMVGIVVPSGNRVCTNCVVSVNAPSEPLAAAYSDGGSTSRRAPRSRRRTAPPVVSCDDDTHSDRSLAAVPPRAVTSSSPSLRSRVNSASFPAATAADGSRGIRG